MPESSPKPSRRRVYGAGFRRGYEAAKVDRLVADWVTSIRSADAGLLTTLRVMRARSRDLANNNDYAKRFLNMAKTNIVGPRGVTLQVRARDDNGQLDTFANRVIERDFSAWGQRGVCTVDGRLSWIDAQKLFVETVARDGEALVRLVAGWQDNPWQFALQFLDIDHLDEQINNGNQTSMAGVIILSMG
jgi:capsid protein